MQGPAREKMKKPSKKVRLDRLLQDRLLAETRSRAQAMILAGGVLVNEQKMDKPGAMVAPDAALRLIHSPQPFVSRGGDKLAAALAAWHLPVSGRICLDIGSSTGGFTDCLLQAGALRVHAMDSGTNQMDWRLRQDPRVRLRENTNARYVSPDALGEAVEFAVCDVSFISVTLILPALSALLAPAAQVVILVKPQFEAGREQVGKGGIVRDPEVQIAAVDKVSGAARELGLIECGRMPSPQLGARGNQEWLLWLTLAP